MHNLSHAIGVAVARRLESLGHKVPPTLINEAAEFAERARVNLVLDNASLCAAMMFTQPLLPIWLPHWKFALTIGVVLGAKFTTEGFWISDVSDHLTQEYSRDVLLEGERVALDAYEWGHMNERLRAFRNALLNVALEAPVPTAAVVTPAEENDSQLHILIVDDCPVACTSHKLSVQHHAPTALVKTCTTAAEACSYWKATSRCKGAQIRLVLIDLHLGDDTVLQESSDVLATILSSTHGFDVVKDWDQAEAATGPARDFRFKPLVALVTAYADKIQGLMGMDGSIKGCDIALPKPLSLSSVGALIECCGV